MGYELIETVEVGAGGASSIEFTSIPQDGIDLVVYVSARNVSTWASLRFRCNSDTASNYTTLYLFGSGSSVISNSGTTTFAFLNDATNASSTTSNTFASNAIYFSNYTSSSAKSISWEGVTEDNATEAYQNLAAVNWNNSSAISSINFFTGGADFDQYTTASLYKITAD